MWFGNFIQIKNHVPVILSQQQSVPSLMNMGNLGSGGMSNFNDNYSNSRNFQDRRRGRMDQRRVEPYNKVKTESPVL